ncbi:hypothetical protein ACFU0X_19695 [Streptomyces cellulosae]|uniref:Uncharacterized protein n=1 Tax=Streptomyces cellulosae TaxID=1968 RepID=A0ABW6JIN1_STRCE
MHFNVFSGVPSPQGLTVWPGSDRPHTWEEVHSFIVGRLECNLFLITDPDRLRKSLEFWHNATPANTLATLAPTHYVPDLMFGVYAYTADEDPHDALEGRLRSVDLDMMDTVGLAPGFTVHVNRQLLPEAAVRNAKLEMRISLLYARVGVPRSAPSLDDARLTARDEALEANFEALCHMLDSPLLAEAERAEATWLVHQLGLARFDLAERAQARGILVTVDPDRTK